MWMIAKYHPAALFSLRASNTTVSGGKTLIAPTPFTIKMALLDATIRTRGVAQAQVWWDRIRDLRVAVALPENLIVVKTIQRILRPKKQANWLGTGLDSVWVNNIVYREYVHFDVRGDASPVCIALQELSEHTEIIPWQSLLNQIQYFGKRGSFMQFLQYSETEALDSSFSVLNPPQQNGFQVEGVMQVMDDCGPKMTFDHADVFSDKRLNLDKPDGRILNLVVLPYRQTAASRSFTAYERIV